MEHYLLVGIEKVDISNVYLMYQSISKQGVQVYRKGRNAWKRFWEAAVRFILHFDLLQQRTFSKTDIPCKASFLLTEYWSVIFFF
jgi:hypothetical protein